VIGDVALDFALDGAIAVGRRLDTPDGDWMPMLISEDAAGRPSISALIGMFQSDASKQAFAETMPEWALKHEAVAVALVISCFVSSDAWTLSGMTRPSSAPARREVVSVELLTRTLRHEWHEAEISRRLDGPPSLGPFRKRRGPVGVFMEEGSVGESFLGPLERTWSAEDRR
jgi:hypothetical protein